MPDRESVITHLQIIHTWAEFARERDLQFFTAKHLEDIQQWSADDIELLKEQEAEWIEYPECLAYDGAYSDSHIVCSACKHVFSIMDNCTEEFDYCPHCGAKMKQEGR